MSEIEKAQAAATAKGFQKEKSNNLSVSQRKAKVKERLSFRDYFRGTFPNHYRDHGNSLCPFHDDQNASFQINDDLNTGYCHAGCEPPGRGC